MLAADASTENVEGLVGHCHITEKRHGERRVRKLLMALLDSMLAPDTSRVLVGHWHIPNKRNGERSMMLVTDTSAESL